MPDGLPRLLIVADERPEAERLAGALGAFFRVDVCQPFELAERLELRRYDQVLLPSGRFMDVARQTAETRDRILLNALGEGVCLTDLDGQVVWSNDRFRGYDAPTQTRIAAACRQAARLLVDPAAALDVDPHQHSRRFEISAEPGKGGRVLEALVSAVASEEQTASGRVWVRYMAAVVWDVTHTRQVQQKMLAIQRAGDELVRIDVDLVRKMHTPERVRVVEQKIVKTLHDLLSFDTFNIRLLDERNGKLELVMSKGLMPEAMELPLMAKAEGNGISGYVAATGRSYICRDTTTDPRYVMGVENARSSLTVPLRISDKVIGVFNVESNKPAAFGEEDLQFAEVFATYIALALHILDLLRVERVETSETVSHTVEDELEAPLEELATDVAKLKAATDADPAAVKRSIDRIMAEVDALKRRVKDVTSGPQHILGADEALTDVKIDPLMAGKRILVADDEQRIRQVIRDVLASRGVEVTVCEDATSAIAALQSADNAPAPTGSAGMERGVSAGGGPGPRGFDLLISDIRLPDKTGYEIFAAARVIHKDLPVILMTGFGYDPHHSIVRASQEGLQCVLFKPFQAERLIEEVHKALARK